MNFLEFLRRRVSSKSLLFLIALVGSVPSTGALPFYVESPASLGRYHFEASFLPSFRIDEFNTPKWRYETVILPIKLQLGLTDRIDFGLGFKSISQSLDTGRSRVNGSRTGLLSPEIKWSWTENVGIKGSWHVASKEKSQNLPIARGDDFELTALFGSNTKIPLMLNIGYLFRAQYRSKQGIDNGPLYRIEPGNVFESRLGFALPWRYNLVLTSELAYYHTEKKKIAGRDIPKSDGSVLDVIIGASWFYKGWGMKLGFGTSCLEETLTSFDLERGAGDQLYLMSLSYHLDPKRFKK